MNSDTGGLQTEATFTMEDWRQLINNKDENQAKLQLGKTLGWEELDFETRPRRTMYIEFLYNTLRSAASVGLPWRCIPAVYRLSRILLDTCVHLEFNASLKTFRRCYEALFGSEENIPDVVLNKLIDVFYESFFDHYHLFRFCFTHERERFEMTHKLELKVPTVESGAQLTTAKEFRTWQYDERLRQIEESSKHSRAEMQENLRRQYEEVEERIKDELALAQPEPDRRGTVKKIVRAQVEKSMLAVRTAIDSSSTELFEMLEKTALPRPGQLGQPPRFKPKSAVALPKPSRADTKAPK